MEEEKRSVKGKAFTRNMIPNSCRNSSNSKERTKRSDPIGRLKEVQAKKSIRRMPWHQEPKKDVTSCDKLWGAANERYIRRFPNVGTHTVKSRVSYTESIGV